MATGIPSDAVSCSSCGGGGGGGSGGAGGPTCCPDSSSCPPPDGSSGGSFSTNPVRYFNGEVKMTAEDLGSGGFGVRWGHTRSYSNQLTNQTDGTNGNSWRVKEWPYVVEVGSSTVCVVAGTIYEALWFDLVSGVYVPRFGAKDGLAHDTANQQYIYNDPKGQIIKFYDYSSGIATAMQGQFKSFTDAGGHETVAGYGSNNQISSFVQSLGSNSSGYYYSYYGSGSNAGQLQYATLQVNGANVRQAKYDYYGSGDANGSLNDLMRVTLQQYQGGGWVTLGYIYYRYYKGGEGTGFAHGLKYVLGQKSYAQMVSQGITPELATDGQLAHFADNYFEYDPTSHEATLEQVGGGTLTYNFSRTTSSNPDGFNNWAVKTEETLPDGSTNIVYTNYAAQVMLKVFQSGTNQWYVNNQYDGSGRLVLEALSSAVASFSESLPGLVTLNTSSGFIKLYDYYASTDLPGGAVVGYLEYEKIQQGSAGTEIILKQYQYTSRTVGSVTIYPIWKETCYPSATDQTLQLQCEIYSYTWQSGTFLINQKTTTFPVVPTTQNGSGSADSRKEAYDAYGRVAWAMDERGYLTNWTYDVSTGAVTQWIQDVDTSVVSGAPSGWTTPSGGGLNLVTDYTVDSLGRVTQELGPTHSVDINGTNTTIRRTKWVVYQDQRHQRWEGYGYATGTAPSYTYTLINPVKLTVMDSIGRVIDEIQATRSSTSGPLAATDSFPQTSWTRWVNQSYDNSMNLSDQRVYFEIPAAGVGGVGTNYNVKNYGYDVMKRLNRVQTPGGTITRNVYHAMGWLLSVWVGTNDNGATDEDPTGGGAPGNDMVELQGNEYDNGNAGGDGNLTSQTLYQDASTTRVTDYGYDFRNRRTSLSGELNTYTAYTYDNLDHLIQVDQREGSASGNLIGRTVTNYDNRERVYQTIKYAVDPSTGTVGNSLTDNVWYDPSGNRVKTLLAGSGMFEKVVYDGVNRPLTQYRAYNTSDTSYPYPVDVSSDTVMQQIETDFDDANNVIQQTLRQRFHNATGTGALTSPSGAQPKARVSYTALYPDPLGRLVNTGDYGTNGGSSFSRPDMAPARSDTVLVNTTTYNDRGEAYQKTDPQGKVDQSTFDDAARLTQLLENYVSGGSGTDQNRESDYTYNADGKVETLTAKNSVTGDQTTTWTYGTTLSKSDVASNELLRSKEYPDGSSDTVTYAYNRLGQVKLVTDQRGSVRELDYDLLGRLEHDRVTTLGSGVDGTVRRISRSYEVRGLLQNLTSYDNATVGSGSVVNDVQYEYNDFQQLTNEYQSHSGAVNTSTTPLVEYAYDDGSANEVRRNAITYPDGTEVDFGYGSSGDMDDVLSRLEQITESSTVLANYSYLGLNQMVITDYSGQPGVELTYYTSGGSGDGGDQYTGLDRFGRVVDQRWVNSSSTDVERVKYGYSRASNRVWRQNTVAEGLSANQDEYYNYDELYQVKSLQRGTLNSGKTGISGTPTWEENWNYDPTGNWNGSSSAYLTKVSGTTTLNQNRTHNEVNEITNITESTGTAWPTPGHDAAGNLTGIPQPLSLGNGYNLTWDAWNRLMTVAQGSTTVATYRYDGASRRVSKYDGTNTRHYYYSDQWQILEERLNTATTADRSFVWGIRALDDLILRDDTTRRLYALSDAMGSVTAVTNTSGSVQERYGYNGFGAPRYMTASFGSRSSSSYDWETLFDGYRYDTDTGLYQVRYRYLHPYLGRWLSRDPIGEQGFLETVIVPILLRVKEILTRLDEPLYSYVRNRPISSVDMGGLSAPVSGPPPSLQCPPGYSPTIDQSCIDNCNFNYYLALLAATAAYGVCAVGCLKFGSPIAILICEAFCLALLTVALVIANAAFQHCIANCWYCSPTVLPPDCQPPIIPIQPLTYP